MEASKTGAGSSAYDALRWINTYGEKGPWSEITIANVAAVE